jgi:hypothetical protein
VGWWQLPVASDRGRGRDGLIAPGRGAPSHVARIYEQIICDLDARKIDRSIHGLAVKTTKLSSIFFVRHRAEHGLGACDSRIRKEKPVDSYHSSFFHLLVNPNQLVSVLSQRRSKFFYFLTLFNLKFSHATFSNATVDISRATSCGVTQLLVAPRGLARPKGLHFGILVGMRLVLKL